MHVMLAASLYATLQADLYCTVKQQDGAGSVSLTPGNTYGTHFGSLWLSHTSLSLPCCNTVRRSLTELSVAHCHAKHAHIMLVSVMSL